MSKTLALKTRLSEKAYALSEAVNTYSFDVPADATKQMVKAAVEAQYDVKVKTINIANLPGKAKRSYRKRGQRALGQRVTIRKAYVRLAADHKLPIFEAVTAAEQAEAEAAEKAAKKSAKEKK